jgi:hypothetical protein
MMTHKQSSNVLDIVTSMRAVSDHVALPGGDTGPWDEVHTDAKDGYVSQISFWTKDRRSRKLYMLKPEDNITTDDLF